jgi:hypothetical protein
MYADAPASKTAAMSSGDTEPPRKIAGISGKRSTRRRTAVVEVDSEGSVRLEQRLPLRDLPFDNYQPQPAVHLPTVSLDIDSAVAPLELRGASRADSALVVFPRMSTTVWLTSGKAAGTARSPRHLPLGRAKLADTAVH